MVKAFNTLPIATMFAPLPAAGLKRVLCIAGDDGQAVAAVAELVADIGLAPLAVGSLAQGGRQMELKGPFSGLELMTRSQEIL